MPDMQSSFSHLRAVFFDFDGVILDTETMLYKSWCHIAGLYGVSFPLKEWAANAGGYQYHIFDPVTHIETEAGITLNRTEVNDRRRAWFLEKVAALPEAPGIRESLKSAASMGLPLAVVSSSGQEWVEGNLERLGLLSLFETICCGSEVDAVKPAPDVYQLALQRLNLTPGQVCTLEDSPQGIAAAVAAGIYCIAVPNQVTRAAALKGYQRRIDSLTERPFTELLLDIEKDLSRAL
ncbi:MAG: Phosphorylated carbohydrates phosphatase [Candidatus Hydrogenedentes bacterium ADurb.Bin170]|jgi:HAD superfamily hydrolase (TIGR01509 family)|nr:MAG: Phosphorylated carbohydrates phosphatase [Candidatus Hydrogenedentes bacterium ADurb.Bin170]